MTPQELQERTLNFALAVYMFVKPFFKEPGTRHVGLQLFRAATSVASNYRAACLARSPKEFSAKAGLLREESDESLFWLIFVKRSGMAAGSVQTVDELTDEAGQLVRIFGASYRTSKRRLGKKRPDDRNGGEGTNPS